MSLNNDFRVHFQNKDLQFEVDFQQQAEASAETVEIDGRNYALCGDQLNVSWLMHQLSDLGNNGISVAVLKDRLRSIGGELSGGAFGVANKAHSIGVQQLPAQNETVVDESSQKSAEESLNRVVDFALSLLFPDSPSAPSKEELVELLHKEENQQKLDLAYQTPFPGSLPLGFSFRKDDDKADNLLPILSGLTQREVMILGTVATILNKNDTLETLCKVDLRENLKGEFLDVGDGRELHYLPFGKSGEGKVCTIMEAGLGDIAYAWEDVQSELENSAYGFSYSRAGLGPSDPAPSDQASIDRILEDFHLMITLLEKKEEIQPPYILVGHSLGGAFMQLYAHLHPENIKGVVLVDSSSAEQISDPRMPKAEQLTQDQPYPPDTLMPLKTAQALFPSGTSELSTLQEKQSLFNNLEVLGSYIEETTQEKPFLGDLPLRVLSVGEYLHEGETELTEEQQASQEIQKNLANLSSNSEQVVCEEGIGHYIQQDAPGTVAKAIQQLY